MKKSKIADVREKNMLVMGLGLHGGGAGAVEFLARHGARVTVTDLRTRRQLAPSLKALAKYPHIRYVLGRHRTQDFLAADMIIKNPGVRRNSPYLKAADAAGIPITSDMGIFFAACPAPIIGVTGTRGKSTTTYLIWKLLKTKYGNRVYYGGNIRKSVLTILPRIKKSDIVVLELSSFQLQDLAAEKVSPHIAVITNLLRDHLNWHRDMREYRDAKSAIFRFQKSGDILFYNDKDAGARRLAARAPALARSAPRLAPTLQTIVDRNLGEHYRASAALAVAVAEHYGITDTAIIQTIRGYRGLAGRQEIIAEIRGVTFVNDTTATIPDAAVAAIQRFSKILRDGGVYKKDGHMGRVARFRHRTTSGAGKLILIAGGSDKKLDFRAMKREMKKYVAAAIFLPGNATEKIKHALPSTKTYAVKSMADAVRTAVTIAQKGDFVVLSPGAASFGLFLNEFDRGDQFAAEVKKLRSGYEKSGARA